MPSVSRRTINEVNTMPMRAPRICGCGYRIASGERCPCERGRKAEHDRRRPSARARGYDVKWEQERAAFLALPENRLCCCGCGKPADTVDHKVPHRGDKRLFWDRSNWQPMAAVCHSSKKQREERRALKDAMPSPGRSQTLSDTGRTGGVQSRETGPKSAIRNGVEIQGDRPCR